MLQAMKIAAVAAFAILAVVALALVPPIGSTDMLDYAIYGRIAALGHSPYVMTPFRLKAMGDPVGAVAPIPWQHDPSVYGPLATVTEKAASLLGGASVARTLLWLKIWNALAFLGIAIALDRLLRSDPRRRMRAHLLWSVNPLMLLAVMTGGHIDGLAAVFGLLGLLAFRRADSAGQPSADRARGKTDKIRSEGEQRPRQHIMVGEVELAEHQAGRRAVEEKVVPLDCRADRRRDHCLAQLRAVFNLGQCAHCRCHSHGVPPPVSSFCGAGSTARFLKPRIYAEVRAWLQGKRLHTTRPGFLTQCSADAGAYRNFPQWQARCAYWVGLFDASTVTGASR